jgi:hypothetical protein
MVNFRLLDFIWTNQKSKETYGLGPYSQHSTMLRVGKTRRSPGYTAQLPESAAAQNPTVKITRAFTQPDPSKVREFADDMRDGNFVLPIGRRLPLRDAIEAHALGEKGGIGKILLLAPDS